MYKGSALLNAEERDFIFSNHKLFFNKTYRKSFDMMTLIEWIKNNFKDSLPIMKLHKTDLFNPPMTEFELPDHFWSDKYAMTSSVKIFKNRIFDVFALQIKILGQNYFYNNSGFIDFNLMYHMTVSNIRGRNWSFWPQKWKNVITSGRVAWFPWNLNFWNPWNEPFKIRCITH